MRIVHFSTSLRTGGAERFAICLANRQQRCNEVALVIETDDVELSPPDSVRMVSVHSSLYYGRIKRILLLAGCLLRVKSLLRPKICHCHSPQFIPFLLLMGCRICLTVHNGRMTIGSTSGIRSYMWRTLMRVAVRCGKLAIVALNRYTQSNVRSILRLNENEVEIIDNGIELPLDYGDRVARRIERLTNSRILRVLWIGRLVAIKQPLLAIESLEKLTERGVLAELTICGEGPLMEDVVKAVSRSAVKDCIHIRGRISDVHAAFDEHDLLWFTSSDLDGGEGHPLVLIEALCEGMPIVAAPATTTIEKLEGLPGVWLASTFNASELAAQTAAMLGYERDELRSTLLQREGMLPRFGIDLCDRKYAEIYKSLLPHPSQASCA